MFPDRLLKAATKVLKFKEGASEYVPISVLKPFQRRCLLALSAPSTLREQNLRSVFSIQVESESQVPMSISTWYDATRLVLDGDSWSSDTKTSNSFLCPWRMQVTHTLAHTFESKAFLGSRTKGCRIRTRLKSRNATAGLVPSTCSPLHAVAVHDRPVLIPETVACT